MVVRENGISILAHLDKPSGLLLGVVGEDGGLMKAKSALRPIFLLLLVVAALATYSYSLKKAWALREGLRKAELFDSKRVAKQTAQQVGNALKKAGYDRGGITYIITPAWCPWLKPSTAAPLIS